MVDDVLILKTSGIPLFAKCYGGSTCKAHPDHALQSGFLAALFSYSKETFSEQGIKAVLFSDFKLNFKVDEERELIMVFTNALEDDETKIITELNQAHEIFVGKYGRQLDEFIIDADAFLEFDTDLVNLNIVPHPAKKDLPLMKESFWQKLFARLT
ncbi:MAG: hypothetical protein ACTSQB_02895 [Candidatus Heimdallarchaeota archaeon]